MAAKIKSGFQDSTQFRIVHADGAFGVPPSVWFDSIVSGDREFRLRQGMKVPVCLSDGLFVLETTEIPIISYGESLADAIADFQNQFGVLWDRIAMESGDKLTIDAQRAKRSQLSAVETPPLRPM